MTTYITSKIDNAKYCKTNGQFSRHLRQNNLTYQSYYETYVTGYAPLCDCGKPLTFYQKSESYANSCGNPKCVGKTVSNTKANWTDEQKANDSRAKKLAASLKTQEQIDKQTELTKQTFLKKYGVEWVTQSAQYKDIARKTKIDKYGNEYYNNSKKSAEKNRSKTAEEQNVINEKRRTTNLERFGVENTFLQPDVIKRSRQGNAKGREYTLPSGKVLHIKGFENLVIDKLLTIYTESDLLIHDFDSAYQLPIFAYVDTRRHHLKYYPDIYIPSENRIIEVKSRWWWDGNGDVKYASRLENNLRKRRSVIAKGYNYELWLFEDKNNYKILEYDTDF